MAYFCTCKKCKNSSQNNQGRFLKTKRTYIKHQKAELLRNISGDLSTTDTNLTNSDDDVITVKTDSEEDKKSDLSDKQVRVSKLFQIKNFSR